MSSTTDSHQLCSDGKQELPPQHPTESPTTAVFHLVNTLHQDSSAGQHYRSPPSVSTPTDPSDSIYSNISSHSGGPSRTKQKESKSGNPGLLAFYPQNVRRVIVTARSKFQLCLCLEGLAFPVKKDASSISDRAKESFNSACSQHGESESNNILLAFSAK